MLAHHPFIQNNPSLCMCINLGVHLSLSKRLMLTFNFSLLPLHEIFTPFTLSTSIYPKIPSQVEFLACSLLLGEQGSNTPLPTIE
jgi:hypothetical protein